MKQTQHQKIIRYQTLLDLDDNLAKLSSWHTSLELIYHYFKQTQPLKKQNILTHYYANSIIFSSFYQDSKKLLNELQADLAKMKQAQAMPPLEKLEARVESEKH